VEFTGWAKKVSLVIIATTLSTFTIFQFVNYREFATSGYVVSPSNMVCVTTLCCKILIMLRAVIKIKILL